MSTTCDVDAVGPIVGSIGGVRTMEGVLTTSDNKMIGEAWPVYQLHPYVDLTPQLPHVALKLE
jgi:hypothetical protein